MLLIWDIHITSKRSDILLQELRAYFVEHADREVVFLGDFVYHFNYDRKAMLAVYDLLLELYKQGRKVVVLAGNHDRLQNSFVFEEAKKAFDILADHTSHKEHVWEILFVTKPQFVELWGMQCLLYPYHIPVESEYDNTYFAELLESDHQQEQRSGRANSALYDMIQWWRDEKTGQTYLPIFHHRYIAGQAFPGQFATFGYKSPALSKEFLDASDLRLISGHLHQPFVFQNYLCVGSVWHTSPLEINQSKFLYQRDTDNDVLVATHIQVNPYIRIESSEHILNNQDLLDKLDEYHQTMSSHMQEWSREVRVWERKPLPISQSTLTLVTDQWYDQMSGLIDDDLRAQFRDVKLKKHTKSLPALVQLLDTSTKDLEHRLSDWKTLLQSFLDQKYGVESDAYKSILDDLQVL